MKAKHVPIAEPEEVTENVDFLGIDPTHQVSGEDAEAFASPHEWKESPGSRGHRVVRQKMEDENSSAIDLVYQGVNEADREQRIAAEPDRPEDEEEA